MTPYLPYLPYPPPHPAFRAAIRWAGWLAVVLTLTLGSTGCATVPAGSTPTAAQQVDPWESFNRKVFAFNQVVDDAVLIPVATAWRDNVPQLLRTGLANVFNNFSASTKPTASPDARMITKERLPMACICATTRLKRRNEAGTARSRSSTKNAARPQPRKMLSALAPISAMKFMALLRHAGRSPRRSRAPGSET